MSVSRQVFHSHHYMRHNARRLEHLASLGITVSGMSVLEVGAGIGDHSHYYLDRECSITITEAREDNLSLLRERYPNQRIASLDMDNPKKVTNTSFDIIHCYGLLYHLKNPKEALEFLGENTKSTLFLETCVSFGSDKQIHLTTENQDIPSQASSGMGCRPTRNWIFSELKKSFKYVYIPKTQPHHEEFPIDWNNQANHTASLQRAIFIASHKEIKNSMLSKKLLNVQKRQK